MLRHRQFLTILTSESLSRAGAVQILSRSTSKSAPGMPVFNHFDFQIALAHRRGANFVDILGSRSFAPPRFSDLPLRAFEATKLWKNTAFRAIPTRQNLSGLASLLSIIDAARPTGNFQYSRKLELLSFVWLYNFMIIEHYMTSWHMGKPKAADFWSQFDSHKSWPGCSSAVRMGPET